MVYYRGSRNGTSSDHRFIQFNDDSIGSFKAKNTVFWLEEMSSNSLKWFVDNNRAIYYMGRSSSGSSSSSSSSISTTEFCKCKFEATNVGHGGHDISLDDATLTNESSNWIYTDTTNNMQHNTSTFKWIIQYKFVSSCVWSRCKMER